MIGQANRFHGQASLRRLQARAQTVRGPFLALKYAPNAQRSSYRLAVVVSRKVSKSAVVRNRIRRRLYETVRLQASGFTGPYDLILVVYDVQLAELASDRLTAEVVGLFKKAGVAAAKRPPHAIVEARRKT